MKRKDILEWVSWLRSRGASPRTVRNRVDHFQIFLHRYKVGSILAGGVGSVEARS